MADTDKPKNNEDEKLLRGTDPKVEAKVDEMMTYGEKSKTSRDIKPASSGSASAPLLPGEKLPDFNKQPVWSHPRSVASTKDKPDESGNQVADKESKPPNKQIEDPATDKAVDEIAAEESDRMLAIEDAKAQLLAEGSAEIDRGIFNRIKSAIKRFWSNPKARFAVLSILVIAIATVAVVPPSRYFALNTLGVRSSTSLRVLDENTSQPLKNVEVSIDGKTSRTDKDGKAKIEKIKLGNQQLAIKKPAFADINQKVVIGWGSNPRGDLKLTAVGSRYTFKVVDFVSDKPAKAVEATSGDASATVNENGEIVLVVADQDEANVDISIVGDNYRTEKINLDVGNKDVHQVKMVPSRKQAFVSKRSGKYDLYKIDVDGKNEEKVLAGTGTESEDKTVILPNSKSNTIAYVSARADQRNIDGFALSSLMIINLDDNNISKIDSSERIQPVDFIGNKLIYVKIAEGASAADSTRHRLISYDIETEEKKELASTNYFNDILSAKGSIYFTPAAYQVNGSVGLFKTNADGSSKSTIFGEEAWNLFRVSYDKINVAVNQTWYEYDISSNQFNKLEVAPALLKSRVYNDSPDAKNSAWVDDRDGKGVLIIYDTSTKEEKVLQTQSGLKNPIRWLDADHLVYRVSTSSETADYVISLSGGEPKKIKDVTNTAGLDRWYYY